MATVADIISRVRLELGDLAVSFQQSYLATGEDNQYDLPVERVNTPLTSCYTVAPGTGTIYNMVLNTDYTLDLDNGILQTTNTLATGTVLIVEGTAYGLFSDTELTTFINEAVMLHTDDSWQTTRYIDSTGFINYQQVPTNLANLPAVEEHLVAMLATIEAMWALSTDAATDIDIVTSEGTHVSRSQRFNQLQVQINTLTDKYKELCSLLNVGLYRIEVLNLRRRSRMTNRLVPEFIEREYDDVAYPTRITPRIDNRDGDFDGPPSPSGNWYGY